MKTVTWPASGPPVVILPSNGFCAELYAPVGERLAAAGRHTTAVTLPGFDGTPALPDRSLVALVEHLAGPVGDLLGAGGTLVGHSLGGMLAFLLTARLNSGDLPRPPCSARESSGRPHAGPELPAPCLFILPVGPFGPPSTERSGVAPARGGGALPNVPTTDRSPDGAAPPASWLGRPVRSAHSGSLACGRQEPQTHLGSPFAGSSGSSAAETPGPPVRALVLLEPAIVPLGPLMPLFARWYRRGAVEVAPGFRNRGPFFWRLHDPARFPDDAWAVWERNEATTDPEVVRALLATGHEVHPLDHGSVTCPVTLVRGTSSGPVMWAAQRLLARRLADARCVDVSEAGHWLVHEQDDALAAAILSAG